MPPSLCARMHRFLYHPRRFCSTVLNPTCSGTCNKNIPGKEIPPPPSSGPRPAECGIKGELPTPFPRALPEAELWIVPRNSFLYTRIALPSSYINMSESMSD